MNRIGSSVAGATATALALGGLLASAPAASASAVSPAAASARSNVVTRTVDIDGDRRADRLTVSLFNVRHTYLTFMVSVKTRSGTVNMPVRVSNEHVGFTASQLFQGTANADGVAGNEILLDLGGGVGDFADLRTYTMRGNRLMSQLSPTQGSWRALFPPFGHDSYHFSTRAGKRYVAHTALKRSTSGRYYGTVTTFGYSNGWKVVSSRNVSGLREREVKAMPLFSGISWR